MRKINKVNISSNYKHIHNGGIYVDINGDIWNNGDEGGDFINISIDTSVGNFGTLLTTSLNGLNVNDLEYLSKVFSEAAFKVKNMKVHPTETDEKFYPCDENGNTI